MAYEQRVARSAYAYGVDLRRSAWLEHSTFGEPLLRMVDRRWNRLTQKLERDVLEPAGHGVPHELLETVAQMVRLLRAPVPTVRAVKAGGAYGAWPLVTGLGTTAGGAHWLLIDAQKLQAAPEHARRFWVGAALGHLQCDHGPLFAAHLLLHDAPKGSRLLRTALRPWSKVAFFSADRAGLLAVGELEPALDALQMAQTCDWGPRPPRLDLRMQALRDFDRSRIMARLRFVQSQAEPDFAPHGETLPSEPSDDAVAADDADDRLEPASNSASSSASEPSSDPPPEPSLTEVEEQIKDAWSLARCDERLTRRLGLL